MSILAWDEVNWPLVESRVSNYQQRIYKAKSQNNINKMRFIQKKLFRSLDAKLFAVRCITTLNKGRNTASVDEKIYLTSAQKSKLVAKLKIDGKACPIRRVFIPKLDKLKKRPLGIPIMLDRAKQVLLLLALEPEWEYLFEPNSYGFRPGRRCHDAIEAIYLSIRNITGSLKDAKYVLDIKGCFDNINHEYLLNKLNSLPEVESQVKAWLEAGIFEGYRSPDSYGNIPRNTIGTPQGGVISPFLANVALHGMEEHLKEWICTQPQFNFNRGNASKMKALTVVRYADDFVVIHKDRHTLTLAKEVLRKWFASTSQLEFSEEKTSIVHSTQGFQFLGFSICVVSRHGIIRAKIYPSRESVKNLLNKVSKIIHNNRSASAYNLINMLRPVILGWANYFRYSECKDTFHTITHRIFGMLRAWVFRRDTRNSRFVIKERYFPSNRIYDFDGSSHSDNWVLNGNTVKDGNIVTNFLPHIVWVKSIKHVKVKGKASIYNGDDAYWALRSHKHDNWTTRQRKLIKRQKGYCSFCTKPFMFNDIVEVDHILPKFKSGKDTYDNLQLLHRTCHIIKTRQDMKDFIPHKK